MTTLAKVILTVGVCTSGTTCDSALSTERNRNIKYGQTIDKQFTQIAK